MAVANVSIMTLRYPHAQYSADTYRLRYSAQQNNRIRWLRGDFTDFSLDGVWRMGIVPRLWRGNYPTDHGRFI